MREFNVIIFDINDKKFKPYDVIHYFVREYEAKKPDLITFDDYKQFINDMSMYHFWARCEYEILLQDWPCHSKTVKKDIHWQIQMNIDVITQIFKEEIEENFKK